MPAHDALIETLTSPEPALADRSLAQLVDGLELPGLLAVCERLEAFVAGCPNLYQRVRALAFLSALQREHVLPRLATHGARGTLPPAAFGHLLERRFEQAIAPLRQLQAEHGPDEANASALAAAYRGLTFATLADQVRASVRQHPGNAWMFEPRTVDDPHPLRLVPQLRPGAHAVSSGATRSAAGGEADSTMDGATDGTPLTLVEDTPVRMDFTHSAWSDIFFLAMDDPGGARVLNLSIDLSLAGTGFAPRPPVSARLTVLDRPLLRLASVDLGENVDLTRVEQVFDFGADHLGLLRAAAVASGLVPPGLEAAGGPLTPLLAQVVGPGCGLALTSQVRDIPKGSRLAVSTTLLASLITVVMRATGQTRDLLGALDEAARQLVCVRAILGEWLGGSGGGWQDSGGLWPGFKLIEGVAAGPGDPEHGASRGRLAPRHTLLGPASTPIAVPDDLPERLMRSLVLVHGGLAQDVGPVLELVTERYLLRSAPEWRARRRARELFDEIGAALAAGDLRRLGAATHENFFGPISAIVPGANNAFTRRLVSRLEQHFGPRFWGFWMLGGLSGGGMGLLFDPEVHDEARQQTATVLAKAHREFARALPFAMAPVVYDWAVNTRGTWSHREPAAPAPEEVRAHDEPRANDANKATGSTHATGASSVTGTSGAADARLTSSFSRMPSPSPGTGGDQGGGDDLDSLLSRLGFDAARHERLRAGLLAGTLGLAANRLPGHTRVHDAGDGDVLDTRAGLADDLAEQGLDALARGELALVTLAAGSGTRWTRGAGVVKALSPFVELAGEPRSFLDLHLAKTAHLSRLAGVPIPHVVTTSHLTHGALENWALRRGPGSPLLSPGARIGLRLVPTLADLRFAWQQSARERLDEQAQKVAESTESALMTWARTRGEASDYRDNLPEQCIHPLGHAVELPNLVQNGTLARLLEQHPRLTTLLVHNVDSVGAWADPALLGAHRASGAGFSFEVLPRRVDDRGGGLARVDGTLRLIESLALPREEDELLLSLYNSLTTWVEIDALLELLHLQRDELHDGARTAAACSSLLDRLPTYITLKEVKRRFGRGHEDVFPVLQSEQLWGDITALSDSRCAYLLVPTRRGRQLKHPSQLDDWLRDGSAAWVAELCGW